MQASTNRIALITGANKGIGFEMARQLGQSGAHVLLGARDAALGEAATASLVAGGIKATFVLIDLDQHKTIDDAAAAIEGNHGRLDVLINNAGIVDAADGPAGSATMEAYAVSLRRIFSVPWL